MPNKMGTHETSTNALLNLDENSSSSKDSMDLPIDLPDDVLREGHDLKKQIEEEESQKVAQALEEHASEEQEEHDMRYKRLMHLLDRSKFYANFLLQRMAAKKEEEKIKQEKQAKREANKAIKEQGKEKENGPELETPSKSSRARGAKRQVEESPTDSPGNKRKRGRVKRAAAISDTNILNVIDEEELQKRATKKDEDETEPHPTSTTEDKMPDLLENCTLRPYQMEGFKWLVALYENGMNGILADEMGLGKTVQCISLIAHLVGKGVVGPFLVCAPLSTLPNWMSEFKRFTPRIPTVLYHGNQEKRDEILPQIAQKFRIAGMDGIKFFPVVVTSFEVVIRDRKVLERFQWRYIIVDEGHRLKNFQCRLVQELKKYPSSNRLLLTGTPLQNNLTELWSLLNFLLPEIFDDLYVFQAWFRVEEFQGDDAERKIVELERKEHVLSMLHQILSPFLLRRVKADVDLQIPPKKELLVYCPMSPFQQELYRATVNKTIADLMGAPKEEEDRSAELQENGRRKRRAKKAINYAAMGDDAVTLSDEAMAKVSPEEVDKELDQWIKLSDDFETHPTAVKDKVKKTMGMCIKMQNPMMQLKKIVNHPYLVRWEVDPETGDYVVDEDMIRDSGKLAVLDQMLTRLIKDGHRTLVFSQMTMMLDILADYCDLKGWKFARLDGAMSLEERNQNIQAFNTDSDMYIFLISTRAGGLGINLTSADTVIIYDSDWNPQADLQAQDRCHRIGQTKPVVVYRLVTADTIDQRVIDRAGAKRKLEKLVIQKGKFKKGLHESDTYGNGMSINELMELLKARDFSGEHKSVMGQVFTQEEMNALMDRSDLEGAGAAGIGAVIAKDKGEVVRLEGVFKRVDPSH